MAGKLVSKARKIEHEFLSELLHQYLKRWYWRFKSSIVMKDGTNNEDPAFEKLRKEDFVKELYEVGLLRDKDEQTIGVSPDGVVMITNDNKEDHYACVEIKIRVTKETILKAELVSKKTW